MKAGETVVEFDPYDAEREAADGQADLTAAQAKIDKAQAEGTKNQASLGLDRDVAKEQLDGAETFKLTDESLFSRHQIIESQLDRELFQARADVAARKLAASGKLSSAERALGEIDAGQGPAQGHDRREGPALAADPGPARRPADARAELARRDALRRRHALAGAEGGRGARPVEARGQGVRARGRRGRPEDRARRRASRSRGVPGEEYEASVSRVEPLAKTRDWQSPVKYFETTLSLAKPDPGDLQARPEGARRRAPRRGGRRPRHPARRRVREGRQARRLPPQRRRLRPGRGDDRAPEHLAPGAGLGPRGRET